MTDRDEVREQLEKYVGKPMGPPSVAPDPVNVPMIRHWVDALDDRNPVYLDEASRDARASAGSSPPGDAPGVGDGAPVIEGIAERGGAAMEITHDNPISALNAAGFTGTLATNSELEFVRYLRPGDHLSTTNEVESISPRKTTGSAGLFRDLGDDLHRGDEVVGRQSFRVFKFDPRTIDPSRSEGRMKISVGDELPSFVLPVTTTVIVAGAIASRDFMPAHHDPDFARAQGAPHMFMNILTTNGLRRALRHRLGRPEARLRNIKIRLGAPAIPGKPLRFTGRVEKVIDDGDERVIEVAVRAANDLGDHATGTVAVGCRAA
jgi:acyl dehydratase